MKRIYRSLFDSDDVYEVEEISDDTEVSTEDIAEVKHDEDGCLEKKEMHTIEDCWKAIQKIADAVFSKEEKKEEVKDDEPAESNKVEPQKVDIDKSKSMNDEEVEEEEEEEIIEDSEDNDEKKEVKDAYSKFAKVTDSKVEDLMTATQVAFQNRYNKVANK